MASLRDCTKSAPRSRRRPRYGAWWLLRFVEELERVLRLDLIRDYLDVEDEVTAARGRIDPLGTARLFYAGVPAMYCEFDEYGMDTPLNRVVKAGAATVAGSPRLTSDLGGGRSDSCPEWMRLVSFSRPIYSRALIGVRVTTRRRCCSPSTCCRVRAEP